MVSHRGDLKAVFLYLEPLILSCEAASRGCNGKHERAPTWLVGVLISLIDSS